jgi:MFS family permease
MSMVFMLIGSTLCAAAQTWGMLLLGRALQGLSAAGIMNIIKIVLSDRVSLKENAKNNTIFAFVSGSSYSIGPVIGGYLTNANWRYCFVISIPIAVASQLAIYFLLRKELVGGTYRVRDGFPAFLAGLATVDVGGTAIFVLGVGCIILATTWGGATYPWSSAPVLAPLTIGALLFGLFWAYEYALEPGRPLSRLFPRQDPMIPFALFRKRDTLILAAISFATGAALYSAVYFIGIYFTLVEAYPASRAGIQLLYYIPGIGVGVNAAMYACNVWPRMTFPPLFFGTITEAAGIGLLTWAVTTRKVALVNGMMALAGAGTGMRFMPNTLHAAGIWPDRIAPTMSVMDFSLPFGGTLALAIMGSVFNNKMANVFYDPASASGKSGFNVHNTESLDKIASLPKAQQEVIRNAGKKAVMWAFASITPLMGLSVLAVVFLGNVWIGGKKGRDSYVLHEPYLVALVKVCFSTPPAPISQYHAWPLSPLSSLCRGWQDGG